MYHIFLVTSCKYWHNLWQYSYKIRNRKSLCSLKSHWTSVRLLPYEGISSLEKTRGVQYKFRTADNRYEVH